jgi:hypothetical protein
MTIKEIFDKATSENKSLTYEEFEALAKAQKANYVDLAEGKYVDRHKYEDDIAKKDTEINTLNDTLATRDTDLANLQTQLQNAGADAGKLEELTASFNELQTKYANETEALNAKLSAQAYQFAVRDFANSQKFSSSAAKRMFEQDMIAKNLPMENGKIMGANDWLKEYAKENKDSFVQETKPEPPKPTFAAPTGDGNGTGTKMTLSEMMRLKNENPNAVISFE